MNGLNFAGDFVRNQTWNMEVTPVKSRKTGELAMLRILEYFVHTSLGHK